MRMLLLSGCSSYGTGRPLFAARFNVRIQRGRSFRIGLHPNAGSAAKQAIPVRIYPSRRGQHGRNEKTATADATSSAGSKLNSCWPSVNKEMICIRQVAPVASWMQKKTRSVDRIATAFVTRMSRGRGDSSSAWQATNDISSLAGSL
jgi:hypothetical protein